MRHVRDLLRRLRRHFPMPGREVTFRAYIRFFAGLYICMLLSLLILFPPPVINVYSLLFYLCVPVAMTVFGPYVLVAGLNCPWAPFASPRWQLRAIAWPFGVYIAFLLLIVFGRRRFRGVKALACTLLLLFSCAAVYYEIPETECLSVTSREASLDTVPVRLAVVSDLHACRYGRDYGELIAVLEKYAPDAVLLPGDILDNLIPNDHVLTFVRTAARKWPCLYTTGNHEFWSGRVDEFKNQLRDAGVHVLEGECKTLALKGRNVDFCGVDDPTYMRMEDWKRQLDVASGATKDGHTKVLLSHRPERGEIYGKYDFDLVVAGHAHGGQWRIPFLGIAGFSPEQGILPKYISGEYPLANGGKLIVSRGLSRERHPAPRIGNRPEILVVDLK